MTITPEHRTIFVAFVLSLIAFTGIFITQQNTEFIGYVIIVALILLVILYSDKHVHYSNFVLWGLFIWAVLHMLGGVEMAPDKVIYTKMLIPVIGEPYNILKYDQVVHAYGFFIASMAMWEVLRRYLVTDFHWVSIGIVVSMVGLGLGALNEIVEFAMTVILPDTNVGGYENTALDLVFNFIGTILAALYARMRYKRDLLKMSGT